MSTKFPDEGRYAMLRSIFGESPSQSPSFYLRLFVNDKYPASTDVLADYTEMSTQGYVQKTLARTNINVSNYSIWEEVYVPNKVAVEFPTQTFTFNGTGGETIVYGWFLIDNEENLIAAERFDDGPFGIASDQDELVVSIQFLLTRGEI